MKHFIFTLFAVLFVGCSEDKGAQGPISGLEVRVFVLERQLASSEAQINQLEARLGSVRWDMLSKLDLQSAAVVDPSSKGYSIARNEYGAFPVIIDDAQPFLDGHKVKFRVGNLTSAAMTDVKLEIVYGLRDPALPTRDDKLNDAERSKAFQQYLDQVEKNKKSRRTLTVDAGKDLAPASWNIVEAIISPSKPEDLGRIEVTVKLTGMKLSTPR